MNARRHRGPRSGFSLLEVILAVGLSVIVVYLVFGAIRFHLGQLTVRKTGIEEAQLARALLRRIADDLRAVVVHRPADFSSVNLPTGAGSSDGSGSSSPNSSNSDTMSAGTAAADDGETVTGFPTQPGIYGTAFELQIDVSRIPRYEEYADLQPAQDLPNLQLLSDVKSVTYALLGQNGMPMGSTAGSSSQLGLSGGIGSGGSLAGSTMLQSSALALGLDPDQPLRGLTRRMVDRAAVRYASQGGDLSWLDRNTELIAPEVMMLQFRYFDGQQWLYEWNTELLGGLPLAVEIVLVLRSPNQQPADENDALDEAAYEQMLWQQDPSRVYRLVVHLPATDLSSLSTTTSADTGMTGSSTR